LKIEKSTKIRLKIVGTRVDATEIVSSLSPLSLSFDDKCGADIGGLRIVCDWYYQGRLSGSDWLKKVVGGKQKCCNHSPPLFRENRRTKEIYQCNLLYMYTLHLVVVVAREEKSSNWLDLRVFQTC